jgi:hypothetical protein
MSCFHLTCDFLLLSIGEFLGFLEAVKLAHLSKRSWNTITKLRKSRYSSFFRRQDCLRRLLIGDTSIIQQITNHSIEQIIVFLLLETVKAACQSTLSQETDSHTHQPRLSMPYVILYTCPYDDSQGEKIFYLHPKFFDNTTGWTPHETTYREWINCTNLYQNTAVTNEFDNVSFSLNQFASKIRRFLQTKPDHRGVIIVLYWQGCRYKRLELLNIPGVPMKWSQNSLMNDNSGQFVMYLGWRS